MDAWLPWLRGHDAATLIIPRIDDSVTGVVVLVEPRPHPHTEFVLRNMVHFLAPQGWGLLVVHGTDNAQFMRDVTAGWTSVAFMELPVANLTLPMYNAMFTDVKFWAQMPHEHLLIVQTDTCLFTGRGLQRGSELLDFGYIGAPWVDVCTICAAVMARTEPVCGHWVNQKQRQSVAPWGGNGGLSLRRRSVMIDACSRYRRGLDAPRGIDDAREVIAEVEQEDVFFSVALGRMGGVPHVAPRAVAATFSVESVLPSTLVTPDGTSPVIGMHKMYAYQPVPVVQYLLGTARYVQECI
jgi:hypothetical protein